MNKTKFFAHFLFFLSAFAFPPTDAAAILGIGDKDKGQQEQKKDVHPIHDDDTFMQKTKLFHLIPFGDTDMEFEIALPANWQLEANSSPEAPDLSKKMIAHIARFSNPPKEPNRILVAVQALQMEHEIDAKNWLKNYILSSGYGLEGEVTSENNLRASGSYVQIFDGAGTHTYITVQISGNTAMLARFQVPLNQKDYLSFLQKKSIDSFRLVFTKEETIEEQKVFTMVDALKFTFPGSWEVSNPNFKDLNLLTVQLHNRSIGGVLEGYIYFRAVRRDDSKNFQDAVLGLRKYFTDELKLNIEKMVSSDKFIDLMRFPFGQMELYVVRPKGGKTHEQNLRLLALADADWYIFMAMITPTESNNLYTWARNERSFDLIARSFK